MGSILILSMLRWRHRVDVDGARRGRFRRCTSCATFGAAREVDHSLDTAFLQRRPREVGDVIEPPVNTVLSTNQKLLMPGPGTVKRLLFCADDSAGKPASRPGGRSSEVGFVSWA